MEKSSSLAIYGIKCRGVRNPVSVVFVKVVWPFS